MMCDILNLFYILLFVVNMVEHSDLKGLPVEENVKLSRRHQHKSRPILGKSNDDNIETTINSTTNSNTRKENNERHGENDSPERSEEMLSEVEEDVGRTGDTQRTVFVGSLAKTHQLNTAERSSDDYSDSSGSDIDLSKVGNANSSADDIANKETGEVLIHSPNQNTLSQDAVLDLKARTGLVSSEIDDNNDKEMESSEENNVLKSGYIPPDEIDDKKPPEYENDAQLNHQPKFQQSGNLQSQLNRANNLKPEFLYNLLMNTRQRYFGSISSSENVYPVPNSREMWTRRNQLAKPYYGINYPNTQYQRYRDCPKCLFSSQERTFRQTDDHKTTNPRPVEFNSSDENAYPLVQLDTEVNRIQVESTDSSKHMETYGQNEEPNIQRPYAQPNDPGPLSKFLSVPLFMPRTAPMFRLGGLPKMFV